QAQDAISKFFGKYETDDSFSHVSMTSRMFGLFTDLEIEDEEDQEILDAISKLKGLKILAKEETDQAGALYKEALGKIRGEYDELMSIRDEDKDMKFMIKEKDGKISELVMVMGGNREFFILSLFGEIDLKQIAKISSAMDIDGLD
ncbi:DUF4252 domain-containing protein, partial [Fulvivirga sp. RKSG066]|uniref:DUF4252 domain-containing protein n=1 Tax=Fulvivirga aurantia TaxID=2529383 RepID=UPI0012BB767F